MTSVWLAKRFSIYNHLQEHDGSRWKKYPVWDSCFPKFAASSKREVIGMYWDYFYLEADRLQQKYPERFRVFDIRDLSLPEGQKRILSFLWTAQDQMVIGEKAHLHQSPENTVNTSGK